MEEKEQNSVTDENRAGGDRTFGNYQPAQDRMTGSNMDGTGAPSGTWAGPSGQGPSARDQGYSGGGYGNPGYGNAGAPGQQWQDPGFQGRGTGTYPPPYQPSPYQGAPQMPERFVGGEGEPVKVSEWIVTLLLLSIPCVNLVMMFIWGFGSSEKESKSNFCKAALIMTGIAFAIVFVIYVVVAAGIIAGLS